MNNNGHRDKIKDYSIKVWHLGGTTMVGYGDGPYPMEHGNCFYLGNANEGKWYKIVNFNYENFTKLMKDGVIKFPVPIVPLGNTLKAMLVDERIPKDCYTDLCRVCFPKEMEDALLNGELSNESKE